MNGAGRALLLAALILLGLVCASNAQDAVSLTGLNASLKGDAALIELHTTGPAQFQVDRFTMGNWVTVWSRNFQSSGVDEIPLDFERPELAALVTGASLVTEHSRPGIRFYLGPAAKRTSVFLLTKDDSTVVVIPGQPGAVQAAADASAPADDGAPTVEAAPDSAAAPSGAAKPADSTPTSTDEVLGAATGTAAGQLDPVEPSTASPAGAARADQIAAQHEAPPETDGKQGFFLPRQEQAASPPTAEQPAHQDYTLVNELPELNPGAKTEAPGINVDPAPQVVALVRDDQGLPLRAQVNFQVPANGLGSGAGGETTGDLGDVSLKDIIDQAAKSALDVLKQPAAPAGAAKAAAPGGISTPGGGSFYGSFQSQAEVSAKLDGGTMKRGKEALGGIMIDLFEILGTPLDQALTLLVAPTDYNIIVDADVGRNTVSLAFKDSQTDLKSALDLITRTYGLDYVVDANTIVVAGKDKINGQLIDYQTRIFVLSYADPKSVKEMLTKTAQLRDDQVEIYNGEETYPTVNDSTKLSEVSTGGGEGGGGGTQIKEIETNLSSTPRNALLVKAVPSQMEQIAALIAELDRKPRVIELEVRVCEAQDRALKNLGITVQNNGLDTPTPITTGWSEVGERTSLDNENNSCPANEAFTIGSFTRSPLSFLATLNTQIQERSVNVLAQPTLSTVEGKQAIYFAGERVPYISKVTVNPTGQQQIEIDFLKLGVTLNFKPRLDADGKLTIDVNPIVSSLIEFRLIGGLMEAPRTSERQLATTVRVGDCEPFVLAGLISDEERKTVTKVPMLGDLPLVGKLFRNTNNSGQRTEIIIVVVPHIHE